MEKIRKRYVAPQAETYDMTLVNSVLGMSVEKGEGSGGNTPEAPMYYPHTDVEDAGEE